LVEFRGVEKKAATIQEQVRNLAKSDGILARRTEKTGMDDLFGANEQDGDPRSFEDERVRRLRIGFSQLNSLLDENQRIEYVELMTILLEIPLVWKSDLTDWLMKKRLSGEIDIEGLLPRERTPKPGYIIVRTR
jgi:hypothetical protein